MRKFNLTEALAGAPLVTRSNILVDSFRKLGRKKDVPYPYRARVDGIERYYTKDGFYNVSEKNHNYDLFMREGEDIVFNKRVIPELKAPQLTAPEFVEAVMQLSQRLPPGIKITLNIHFQHGTTTSKE